MLDVGSGPPIVVIPGIQGRWEWMRPAIAALAARHRVLTFSLSGDWGSASAVDAGAGLDNFVRQIDRTLDGGGLPSATICGVSYGGLVAMRYAAERSHRTTALILVATPGPRWTPNARVRAYVCRPFLSTPAFIARSPARLWPEIREANRTLAAALAFSAGHIWRIVRAPMRPGLMAQRIGFLDGVDRACDARRVSAPTLVITGEPALDRVVSVEGSRQLAALIPGARLATLDRTGHIGLITRPNVFAELVTRFLVEDVGRSRASHSPQRPQSAQSETH
ncbi:MAG: alpha/beta hydrolase [Acidobacteria bacterium]|nr:alpha/beta hydrolase [Acidobacteriota bacterium]